MGNETQTGEEDQTQVGHCKSDKTDVYAGRGKGQADMLDIAPGGRGWLGNPFYLEHGYTRSESIRRFRQIFEWRLEAESEFREYVASLSGKALGCWCRSIEENEPPCHADVIAEHADRLAGSTDTNPDQ